MQVTRMDLDGTGSPMGLVARILKAAPGLTLPVPIEELALQLDISEICTLTSEGYEGGLITDVPRSSGYILVKADAQPARRRFTIGHELGHFLMVHHKPPQGGFMCSRDDMRRLGDKEQSAAIKMEVEANEFAALLLMPPPLWRKAMAQYRDPDLGQIVELARQFGVSKEAAARSFAQYHDETLAIVVAHNGVIDRIYRKPLGFPALSVRTGHRISRGSSLFSLQRAVGEPSPIVETRPEYWIQSSWGKALPAAYEQVLLQQNGFALIMLWVEAEPDEETDPDEDRTSKQRLQDRLARWRDPHR